MFAEITNITRFIASHPLTRGRRLEAYARFIKWQVASRIRAEIDFPWIEGAHLVAKRGLTGATGNIYAGLHEFADMKFVLDFLRPGDLFGDVGANIGSYTVLASAVAKADTVAFEPDPIAAQWLLRNVDANGMASRVEVRNTAVGAQKGIVRFSVGLDTMNHIVDTDAVGRSVAIESLDEAMEGRIPAMLKIDVEGHEDAVITGAAETLASAELKAILTEGQSSFLVSALRDLGFRKYAYDGFTRRLSEGGDGHGGNALFLRDLEHVMARLSTARPIDIYGQMI